METEEVEELDDKIKIIVARGIYMETYAPLPRDKKEAEYKVKREVLKELGLTEDEIDEVIDGLAIEFDEGVDGRFDDGPYTPIQLVKIVGKEPAQIEIEIEIPEEEKKEEPDAEPRQTMLQQFYGDREAEKNRRKQFDRFKSHVTKKMVDVYDKEGTKRQIEVYTVEDYDGKEKDSNDLLLDGYQTRLERLSRAHQGDFLPYIEQLKNMKDEIKKEIREKYAEMHEVDPEGAEKFLKDANEVLVSFESEDVEKKTIQALIDQDTEFIETNNYTYNSRQNTAENLKTLGKFGEKSVTAPISKDQSFAQKLGLRTMNLLIGLRNHTTAPINKAIGTYVASPIFRKIFKVTQSKSKEPVNVDGFYITPMEDMLATSQKHSRGTYSNKPLHRYHARKDYFISKEKANDADERAAKYNGKARKTSVGKLIKMAFLPRIQAVVGYQEGNAAILRAGLSEVEEATKERKSQISTKRRKIYDTLRRIAKFEHELEELKILEKASTSQTEKNCINAIIEQREKWVIALDGRYEELKKVEIDSVSTDAVSMSQHDKANKAKITMIVKGFKSGAKIAAGVFISRYLYREIKLQAKTDDSIDFKYKTIREATISEVTENVPGMDVKGVSELTIGDIFSKGNGILSYSAGGGNVIQNKFTSFRGLVFNYGNKTISSSDGIGFDITGLTNVQIGKIDENTSIVSAIQETLQNYTGENFTADEVAELLMDGKINGIKFWMGNEQGKPMGWTGEQNLQTIIEEGSHEVTREVVETAKKKIRIPVKIDGTEYEYYEYEPNLFAFALETALAASEIEDWNDLLRYTRSQRSIEERSLREQAKMENENGNQEKAEKYESKVAKGRETKSFARSSKDEQRRFLKNEKGSDMNKADLKRAKEKGIGKTTSKRNKPKTTFEVIMSRLGRGKEEQQEIIFGEDQYQFNGRKKHDMRTYKRSGEVKTPGVGYDENKIEVNEKEPELKKEAEIVNGNGKSDENDER